MRAGAEVKIPFSQLKFGDAKEQVWGLQSTRRYFRAEERSVWQRAPDAPGWVSEFGELRGIADIEPQKQVEIQPFVVAQQESYPEERAIRFAMATTKSSTEGSTPRLGSPTTLRSTSPSIPILAK
jgi:hypothetical protein